MKNKTYKDFTQNPQFACPYAIRDLIKGLDSKDIRKLLILLMHHLQPIWKGLKGLRYPKTKEEIIQIVCQETSTLSREVLNLISSLPKRSSTAILPEEALLIQKAFLPLAPKSKFQFEKYCKESFQPLSYNIINLIIMLLNLRH